MSTESGYGVKEGKSGLVQDFKKRYEQYSKLGWGKGTSNKSTVEGQSPAFIIRLVNDQQLVRFARFPELQKELKQLNIVFQYIKYAPKKAAAIWARDYLNNSKQRYERSKLERVRKGLSVVGWKSPTRETLGITAEMEKFKNTYPKITYRKLDGTIDVIKSDWKGYLVTSVQNGVYPDGHILGTDFFFKNPATMRSNLKEDIDERVFRKVGTMLGEIDDMLLQFEYGDDSMYEMIRSKVIKTAKSLTPQGLDEERQDRLNKYTEQDLQKNMLIESQEVTFDSKGPEETSSSTTQVDWEEFDTVHQNKNSVQENETDSFDNVQNEIQPVIKKETTTPPVNSEVDWDSFA